MTGWLVKTEPEDWSWEQQQQADHVPWVDVRNFQAQKHMRAMQVGDPVLFYHTGKERRIVGLCQVTRNPYPDPSDETGRFCMVDLKAVTSATNPVSLAEIKTVPALAGIALVRQSRLSVMPIPAAAWAIICKMAGLPQ